MGRILNRYIFISISLAMMGCASPSDSDEMDFSMYQNFDGVNEQDACNCQVADEVCLMKTECNPENDIYRAPFDGNEADGIVESYPGYYGRIDSAESGCFIWSGNDLGGDIDYIRVKTKSGTPLNVSVRAAGKSKMKPVISLIDMDGYPLMVGYPYHVETSMDFLAPGDEFYIGIEDEHNQRLSTEKNYSCVAKDLVGGTNYDYLMHVNPTSSIYIRDMGIVSESLAYPVVTLNRHSEIHYYKVQVSLGYNLKITVTPKKSVCEIIYSYEVKDTHQWGIRTTQAWESQIKSGITEGIIPSSAGVTKGDMAEFTLMIMEYTGENNCTYELVLEASN